MNTLAWVVFGLVMGMVTFLMIESNYEEGQKNTAPIAWFKDDVGFADMAYSVKVMTSPHRLNMVRKIVSENYPLGKVESGLFQGKEIFKKDPALYTTILAALFMTQNESMESFKSSLSWWQKRQTDWQLFNVLVAKFS